jgi:hypothetical protein
MLRKNPAVTAVIVVSLAVGIGANSAVFSVVDALLLRPLPYPEPNRLAAIGLQPAHRRPAHHAQWKFGDRGGRAAPPSSWSTPPP